MIQISQSLKRARGLLLNIIYVRYKDLLCPFSHNDSDISRMIRSDMTAQSCKSRVSFYTSIIRGVSSKIISLGRKRVSEECHFRLSGLHNKTVADG